MPGVQFHRHRARLGHRNASHRRKGRCQREQNDEYNAVQGHRESDYFARAAIARTSTTNGVAPTRPIPHIMPPKPSCIIESTPWHSLQQRICGTLRLWPTPRPTICAGRLSASSTWLPPAGVPLLASVLAGWLWQAYGPDGNVCRRPSTPKQPDCSQRCPDAVILIASAARAASNVAAATAPRKRRRLETIELSCEACS